MTRASSRRPGPPTRTERGIPEATVARLPVYLRALTALSDSGIATASSEDLATAAETYTILTVGEGLVTSIPALLVSLAGGLITTRAAAESHLVQTVTWRNSAVPATEFLHAIGAFAI